MRDQARQRFTSRRADKMRRVAEWEARRIQRLDELPTFKDIGKKLGLSTKTVARAYYSAMKKLRRELHQRSTVVPV